MAGAAVQAPGVPPAGPPTANGTSQQLSSEQQQPQASSSYRQRSDLPDWAGYRLQHDLAGHTRAATAVRFSSDGQLLASASADGTAKIWQADTGHLLRALTGHSRGLSDVAWSQDGRMLVTASDDHTLRLWNAATGACLRVLTGHTHFVFCCAFNVAGNLLASGSFDETIRVWDVHSGRCIKVIPGHSDPVSSVSFSYALADPLIASASFDGISRIWHAASGRCLKSLVDDGGGRNPPPPLSFSRFTPNSRFVLTASFDPDSPGLHLWDFESKRVVKTYEGHINMRFPLQAAFVVNDPDPSLKYVICGSEDHHIYAWNLQTRQIAGLLRGRQSLDAPGSGHAGVVMAVDATPAGPGVPPLIASAGREDCAVKVWEHVSAST